MTKYLGISIGDGTYIKQFGPELLPNGDFSTGDLSGYSVTAPAGGASIVWNSGGFVRFTADGTNAQTFTRAQPTIIGASYRLRYSMSASRIDLVIGNNSGGTQVLNVVNNTAGTIEHAFVAQATATYIRWYRPTALVSSSDLDNISLTQTNVPTNYENDIEFDASGNLIMATETRAIAQHAKQRTMSFIGEWFLNLDDGMPWLSEIMGKRYNPALAEAIVKAEVAGTPGVTDITSFSVSFAKGIRNLIIKDVTVLTEFDEETQL